VEVQQVNLGGGGGAGGYRLVELNTQLVETATLVTVGGGGSGGSAARPATGSSSGSNSYNRMFMKLLLLVEEDIFWLTCSLSSGIQVVLEEVERYSGSVLGGTGIRRFIHHQKVILVEMEMLDLVIVAGGGGGAGGAGLILHNWRRSRRIRVFNKYFRTVVPHTQVEEVEELLQCVINWRNRWAWRWRSRRNWSDNSSWRNSKYWRWWRWWRSNGPAGCTGSSRRFRYRYRKRIKQGQWIVATESTI
jgi:hypothetical protein